MLIIFCAIAEFERELILQRQREVIQLAKAAGKYKGRHEKNFLIIINRRIMSEQQRQLILLNITKFRAQRFTSGYINNFLNLKVL